jgi:acyl dehydratase
MIDKRLIGTESSPVANEVEKGAIRKFAEAIGDSNPLYYDEAYAAATAYGRIIAPPTFSRTFRSDPIPGLKLPAQGLVHGEQEFTYNKPIFAGDVIAVKNRLVDVYEKEGRSGKMIFVVMEQIGTNQHGEEVYRSSSSVIIREQLLAKEGN